MTRCLGIMFATLVFTTGVLGQSGAPATTDLITGKWSGSIGPGATPGYGVTLDLKFDGTRNVSGTAQGQDGNDAGAVKTGTFDPQTGILRLEIQLRDAGAVATFDGVVALGMATGRLSLSREPDRPGTFVLRREGAGAAPTAPAAPATNGEVAKRYAEVSGWIMKSAELVPADKYTYRPVATVRTFGQLIAHIADGLDYECSTAAGATVKWSDATEKGRTDKATLLPKLKQSIEACTAVQASGQPGPLVANVAHTSLHYGNVITYLRMLGLVPPS